MIFIKEKGKGLLVCFGIAAAALLLGQWIPIIGGPVFAILIGMLLAFRIREEEALQAGIIFTSKKILQYAVILLGFGLNLSVIAKQDSSRSQSFWQPSRHPSSLLTV